jgi:DNA-binding Lrp family transcriptional regulator
VRALRDRDVIVGQELRLDLPSLGYPIQAVIKVRLGSHGAELVNSLYDDLVRIPGVIEAIHVAGADDFHLHVAVESPEALRDLVLQHITVHRVVRQTETQLIFETRRGVGVLG